MLQAGIGFMRLRGGHKNALCPDVSGTASGDCIPCAQSCKRMITSMQLYKCSCVFCKSKPTCVRSYSDHKAADLAQQRNCSTVTRPFSPLEGGVLAQHTEEEEPANEASLHRYEYLYHTHQATN